ncbi:MAG: alpha/beta hydrolase [Lachnospiraceae bacterium]|nr:alpha/beta hydrolase [Lachnospiraceae bacterium]
MRPITILLPDEKVKIIGIMHFVHGMQEHRKRYNHVLDYFRKIGYICAISDIRGHGENITTKDDLGYFSNAGVAGLVNDVDNFNNYLKKIYPGLPIILIGHSMGSFLVRIYLKKHSNEVSAAIISGSPSYRPFAREGKMLFNIIALFKGWKYRSPLVTKFMVELYDKPFAKEGQKNAWLTRDGDIVDSFNRDPLCGVPFTLNGYKTLANLLLSTYSKDGWKHINKNLPIMFISGGEDPCRINDKKWQDAVNHLKSVGFKNIYSKMYPGMRHELFNEIGKEEVFSDITKFLELCLGIEHDIY